MSDTKSKKKRESTRLRRTRHCKRPRRDSDVIDPDDVQEPTSSTSFSVQCGSENEEETSPNVDPLNDTNELSKSPVNVQLNNSPEYPVSQNNLRLNTLHNPEENDAATIEDVTENMKENEEALHDPLADKHDSDQFTKENSDDEDENLFAKLQEWSSKAKLPTDHLNSLVDLLKVHVPSILPDTSILPEKLKIMDIDGNERFHENTILSTQEKNLSENNGMMEMIKDMKISMAQMKSEMKVLNKNYGEIKNKLEIFMKTFCRSGRSSQVKAMFLKNHFCDSMEKLEDFDSRLKTDPEFRKMICQGIWACIDTELPVQRSIGEMLKELMSKDLLNNFVAQRATKNKKVLIELELWNCIQETVIEEWQVARLPPMKKKTLEGALSKVINNSKDWVEKYKTVQGEVETIFIKGEK